MLDMLDMLESVLLRVVSSILLNLLEHGEYREQQRAVTARPISKRVA